MRPESKSTVVSMDETRVLKTGGTSEKQKQGDSMFFGICTVAHREYAQEQTAMKKCYQQVLHQSVAQFAEKECLRVSVFWLPKN
ncbi:hypothetical protein TNCV_947111 [Trichonephila clavipes]|nr:hypothetical protein TNCV_947111 [Trichonephila clavipes]